MTLKINLGKNSKQTELSIPCRRPKLKPKSTTIGGLLGLRKKDIRLKLT